LAGSAKELKRQLRRAGLNNGAIDAAWPDWWTDEADAEPSARAELRFALARRLGLSPKALLGERVEFVWRHNAKFKHLTAETEAQQAALASFGLTVGRLLLNALPNHSPFPQISAPALRSAILASRHFVDLEGLLAACWGLGVPVIHLRVFPLDTKSMQAMVVHSQGRYAILLGFDAPYAAQVAFSVAHEIGHAAIGHLDETGAIVDFEPHANSQADDQEQAADHFALEVLTGFEQPEIITNLSRYNATTLAAAVVKAAPQYRVDPGTLALCLAHQRSEWPLAMAALEQIYGKPKDLWRQVNEIADYQLTWDEIGGEASDYLRRLMGAGE
jgi:hypothetical protein